MPNYLAELIIKDSPVLMIGGGMVAKRKLDGLLTSGARITVIAPELHPEVAQRVWAGQIRHIEATFQPHHLEQKPTPVLLFAATGTAEVNRAIALLARERGILCNSADDPETSGFLVPAVLHRGEGVVAVATGGGSPALARVLKERFDGYLEPEWGAVIALFAQMRPLVKTRLTDPGQRQRFWRSMALATLDQGRLRPQAVSEAWFLQELERAQKTSLCR